MTPCPVVPGQPYTTVGRTEVGLYASLETFGRLHVALPEGSPVLVLTVISHRVHECVWWVALVQTSIGIGYINMGLRDVV